MRNLLKRGLSATALVRALAKVPAVNGPAAKVVVLMYHDLRADDDFPNWLRVPVSVFDRQLAWLGRVGRFIGPADLERRHELQPGVLHFLLTFDDGYVNNLTLARPLLAKHRAPALFFVSTGPMQSQEPFWSDVVVTAVQGAGLAELDLQEWGLGSFRFRTGDPAARWEDVQALLVALKARGNEDDPVVAGVLEHLRQRHAGVLERHLPRFRPLRPEEVTALAADPWCSVGSHSHRHALLPLLGDAELQDNLARSRRVLEGLVGGEVRGLAYPNGDWDERVEAAAAAAGYRRGFTIRPGLVTDACPPLRTPRMGVAGVGPEWILGYRLVRLLAERGS
ncbi:MAG: polysaccharide deacetylase family protein [Krumholzibacteria bacterium]|nr:polysaccharide deacetylase family protein [Candidatus Krumholzibacteria bacterium]